MPHSSGGGSHSGGFHGGGHSYSRSSSNNSDSFSSSSHISRTAYTGCHRYVYYDRHGQYHNLYSNGNTEKSDLGMTIFCCLLFAFLAGGIVYLISLIGIFIPKKLNMNTYHSRVIVEDHVGILDCNEIEPALGDFLVETGISPAIELVLDSEWENHYNNLEIFASTEYLRMFNDEKHWLVVVSLPDDYENAEFVDWKWEGMIGDDCSGAVDYSGEQRFTKTMHKYLVRSKPDELSGYLADAYSELSGTIMASHISVFCVILMAIIAAMGILIIVYFINDYVSRKHLENAKLVSLDAAELNCEYCGRLYIAGSVSVCPGCGAPIPARIVN